MKSLGRVLLAAFIATPVLLFPPLPSAGTGAITTPSNVQILISNPFPPTLNADLDVECASGRKFHLSTGTKTPDAGCVNGGESSVSSCKDASGNFVQVDCSMNGGKGGCSASAGSGSCTQK